MVSFAALEQRVARAAVNRTANASGEWRPGGGAPAVPGLRLVLDRETADSMDGMVSAAQPVVSVFAGDMPGASRGQELVVTPDAVGAATFAPVTYQIRTAEPDGAGLLVLSLVATGAL